MKEITQLQRNYNTPKQIRIIESKTREELEELVNTFMQLHNALTVKLNRDGDIWYAYVIYIAESN